MEVLPTRATTGPFGLSQPARRMPVKIKKRPPESDRFIRPTISNSSRLSEKASRPEKRFSPDYCDLGKRPLGMKDHQKHFLRPALLSSILLNGREPRQRA